MAIQIYFPDENVYFCAVPKNNDQYKTISKASEGYFKDKGSKFLSFAIPCENVENAKLEIEQLRKDHHSASHVCFAWRFGTESFEDRYSDDGEPNNSAGKPIFRQIIAFDVTNILIAVVRYYGGTNLGVGGLISAYKNSAKLALDNAKIKICFISDYYKITYTYEDTGLIMSILHKFDTEIQEQNFDAIHPTITVSIKRSNGEKLVKQINAQKDISIKLIKTA
jgi:uncharacterized YigZ family protein